MAEETQIFIRNSREQANFWGRNLDVDTHWETLLGKDLWPVIACTLLVNKIATIEAGPYDPGAEGNYQGLIHISELLDANGVQLDPAKAYSALQALLPQQQH